MASHRRTSAWLVTAVVALGPLAQVRWEDPGDAAEARRHLLAHREALTRRTPASPTNAPRR